MTEDCRSHNVVCDTSFATASRREITIHPLSRSAGKPPGVCYPRSSVPRLFPEIYEWLNGPRDAFSIPTSRFLHEIADLQARGVRQAITAHVGVFACKVERQTLGRSIVELLQCARSRRHCLVDVGSLRISMTRL